MHEIDCACEPLESVNRIGKIWTNVVEPGSWSVETAMPKFESDIHTVIAEYQFACHITGDMKA